MELDFEARSATFEETLDALSWIFPASSEKNNQKFKQCLEHLSFIGLVFVPKERNWGGVPLFVPLSKLQIFSETRREGRGVTFTQNSTRPPLARGPLSVDPADPGPVEG